MKKLFALTVIVLMGVASTGWALPEVTLDENCPQWSDVEVGINARGESFWFLLDPLGLIGVLPETWAEADLEGFTGDGCLDQLQVALVAANVCVGAEPVTSEYAGNLAAWAAMIAKFNDLLDGAGPLGGDTGSLAINGAALEAFATGTLDPGCVSIGEPYCTYAAQCHAVAAGMLDAADTLGDFVADYTSYVSVFAGLGYWICAMAGTSEAMSQTWQFLLFDPDEGIVGAVGEAGVALAELSGYLHTLAGALGGLGQAELAGALEADANALDALVAIIATIGWPEITIYGTGAKTVDEPFSGPGDYNGNGDTNAQVAAAFDGDLVGFVEAASGLTVFYPGNPALPITSVFGLMALVGVTALGGTIVLRKK